eukprot:GHVN01033015.1.p1 GENE.GHVN01033015.1~~GHVN01033015.1.p1  ORF type:complete len:388 (+),score=33.38 GHVN01033015.1:2326-3489(+)
MPASSEQTKCPHASMPSQASVDPCHTQDDGLSGAGPQKVDHPNRTAIHSLQAIQKQNEETLRTLKAINTSAERLWGSEAELIAAQNVQAIKLIQAGVADCGKLVEREQTKPPKSYLRPVTRPIPLSKEPELEAIGRLPISNGLRSDEIDSSDKSVERYRTQQCVRVGCLELTQYSPRGSATSQRLVEGFRVHDDPEVVLWQNLALAYECEEVIKICEGRWRPSLTSKGVMNSDPSNYVGGQSTNRTSWSVRLGVGEHPLVSVIERRVAAAARLPLNQLECLVVVRYEPGQVFREHHDGDFRTKTVLLYLSDVERGGETSFPALGIQIRPKIGSAVSWCNVLSDGAADLRTSHSGDPPLIGTKYAVNCFFSKTSVRPAERVTTSTPCQ